MSFRYAPVDNALKIGQGGLKVLFATGALQACSGFRGRPSLRLGNCARAPEAVKRLQECFTSQLVNKINKASLSCTGEGGSHAASAKRKH